MERPLDPARFERLFRRARRLTPIRQRLQQDYGEMPNNANISNILVELVNMHILERRQESASGFTACILELKNESRRPLDVEM